ncbi:hypothetical protein BH09BAC1_BH09BAC1_29360 [soil metagenome]
MTRLLLVLLCSSVFNFAQAQINIVSTDLPTAPDTLRNAIDTVPVGISVGPKGANQTWNFSAVVQDVTERVVHRVPASTPYSSSFSTATNAITTDGNNYGYFHKSSTAFTCQGIAGDLLDNGQTRAVVFNPTFDLYRFPTNYNNTFTGTYGFQETASGSSVGQPVDQVRVTFTATYFDTIDGWGTVITPVGSYQSLRQKRRETSYTKVEYKLFSFSPWTTANESRDTTVTYAWLAKETKGPAVTINLNKAGLVTQLTYSLIPPAPVANFSWTNPSGALVLFTDLSTNSPTSWSWDYGDGSPLGTTRNPNHIYAANSTYNACLTATNSTGSNTICKNVTVTNIGIGNSAPVAIDDSVSTPHNTAVEVDVKDNDIDPESNTMTVTGAYNNTGGTNMLNTNGTVTFTPTNGFSGAASFNYIICDDGVPSLCDTATVRVQVGSAPIQNQVDFTYVDSCLTVKFTNTSTEAGTISWVFGDGQSGGGDTVTHTYAARGTYEVCLTISGFAGSVDTCHMVTVDTCNGTGLITINTLTLQLYPNPATNQLTVVIPNGNKGGQLVIVNQLGMVVKEVTLTDSSTRLSISELAAGIYHLTYTSAEGTLGAGRFVKE